MGQQKLSITTQDPPAMLMADTDQWWEAGPQLEYQHRSGVADMGSAGHKEGSETVIHWSSAMPHLSRGPERVYETAQQCSSTALRGLH